MFFVVVFLAFSNQAKEDQVFFLTKAKFSKFWGWGVAVKNVFKSVDERPMEPY